MKIIGIGVSSAEIGSVIEFLRFLPSDTNASFVLIPHFSVDHKVDMVKILSEYTTMPVVAVRHSMALEPNHIYINTTQQYIKLQHNKLISPEITTNKYADLPIDRFLYSLATASKQEAIAVLLSGVGIDGLKGGKRIKENGGLLFVQHPRSARSNEMPRAVIDLKVDVVQTPRNMAKILADTLSKQSNAQQLKHEVHLLAFADANKEWFSKILKYVSQVKRIDFSMYRASLLIEKVNDRMLLAEIDNSKEYYYFLKGNQQEIKAIADDFLVSTTEFFREIEAFQVFQRHIIPVVVEKNNSNDPLRLWVVGCSTGEEAYTIAMLLDDYLKRNKIAKEYKIFASDVNPQAVQVAAKGVYTADALSNVPQYLHSKYLEKNTGRYRISKEIQNKVLFAVHNILSDPPFIHMDVISCQNLLTYLEKHAQKKLLATFNFALNSQGYLFLAPHETLGEFRNAFRPTLKEWNFFKKR